MNPPHSSATFVTAVLVAIFIFGFGLTSPIRLMIGGEDPVSAMQTGMPIIELTVVGLAVTAGLGVFVQRLGKPSAAEEAGPYREDTALAAGKHRIVHLVTMLMFIVPFLTILLGLLLRQVVDAE